MPFAFAVIALLIVALVPQDALAAKEKNRHWTGDAFTLQVAPGAVIPLKVLRTATEQAAAAWNVVGAGPEILVAPAVTTVREPALDGVNAVFVLEDEWPWDPSEIALTFAIMHATTGEIVEVDVAINAVHHRFGDTEDTLDVQNVLTHELGHALGLRHLDDQPEATMYPSIKPGEMKKRDLDLSDEGALLANYEGIVVDGPAHGCSAMGPSDGVTYAGLLILAFWRRTRARRRLLPFGK